MLTITSDINDVKQEVLRQVAKLAFEGTLEEKRDDIPYEMLPGPKATFRCCVYREREIIRQRIRLAERKYPAAGLHNHNIVQVLDSACAECPIQRYVVTDNCQKCLGKKCMNACKFGAISIGRDKAYIDPDKCKECGKCAQSCPYNAISDHQRPCKKSCPVNAINTDENGIVTIDDEKCIHCGACIKNCPFGALSDISFIVPVIKAILKKKPVYAMVAPAAEGQFGKDVTMGDPLLFTSLKATCYLACRRIFEFLSASFFLFPVKSSRVTFLFIKHILKEMSLLLHFIQSGGFLCEKNGSLQPCLPHSHSLLFPFLHLQITKKIWKK